MQANSYPASHQLKQKAIEATKRWNEMNPGYAKEYAKKYDMKTYGQKWRIKKLGLEESLDEIKNLLNTQKECTICGCTPENGNNLNIDHDHITGKFRGLLCHNCNLALGLFKDNIDNLLNAIEYLKNNTQTSITKI